MVKKFSLVLNNNISKSKLRVGGVHVSQSTGMLAVCRFYGQFLAYITCQEELFKRIPFSLQSFGGRLTMIFDPCEYDGKLLREALQKCIRMSAEISLVSESNIAIKFLFYEKGKKEWYASFQLNFSADGGLYSGGGANVNILGNKTNFD